MKFYRELLLAGFKGYSSNLLRLNRRIAVLLLVVICANFPLTMAISSPIAMAMEPSRDQAQKEDAAFQQVQQGKEFSNQGNLRAALEKFKQALTLYQELVNPQYAYTLEQGEILLEIGEIYLKLDNTANAKSAFQQAIDLYKNPPDIRSQGRILNNIGLVYRRRGQFPPAIQFYQQAIQLLKQAEDLEGERLTLINLGILYRRLENYPQALEVLNQALAMAETPENLMAIGQVYESLKQPEKAQEFYQKAEKLAKALAQQPPIFYSAFGEVTILIDDDIKAVVAQPSGDRDILPGF